MPAPLAQEAQTEFEQAYPAYAATRALDDLRANDYARLDAAGHIYLDYTGGGLYAESQLRAHHALLSANVFGNPHSSNPTSLAMTELVESARRYVLAYFQADPAEYTVVFTGNASGALKLVGEAFPFEPDSQYVLTFDNHNSVNGIREYARARGAHTTYVPVILPDMRLDEEHLRQALDRPAAGRPNLFAFPAQSNFSGAQHDLNWIGYARERGWRVLLDAAAFAPTNCLDLNRWRPDFVPLSFYKMFGYPTGVGCLLARRAALAELHRPWFAGGAVTVVSVQGDRYFLAEGETAFEDGTVNYLNLPAVEIGLRHLQSIGVETIHNRVRCLTGWLVDQLLGLTHANGRPLARLYGPADTRQRGGTLTFNFYRADGSFIDHRLIEKAANAHRISLRSGCFCNPGGGEIALGLDGAQLSACFRQPGHQTRLTQDDFRLCIDGQSSGAVRVSLGLASNFADACAFYRFAQEFVEA